MTSSWKCVFDRVRAGLALAPGGPVRTDSEEALRDLEAFTTSEGIKILPLSRPELADEHGEPMTQAQREAPREQAFGLRGETPPTDPWEETLSAMREARQGGLAKHATIEALMADLNDLSPTEVQQRLTSEGRVEVLRRSPEDQASVAEAHGDSPASAETLRETLWQQDEMWRSGAAQAGAELLPPYEWGTVDPERDGEAIRSVRQGLKDSAEGKLVGCGSFAQHVDDEEE